MTQDVGNKRSKHNSTLGALEAWYRSNCDGDWEHQGGLTIESVDNPGWLVTLRLDGIGFPAGADVEKHSFNNSDEDDDWAIFSFEEGQQVLKAAGAVGRLEWILDVCLAEVGALPQYAGK